MQFEKDIFISYAHIDDEALINNQPGWIANFHRALEIRLAQLTGRKLVIWRDPRLQGNHVFDRHIVEQFEQSAVMIAILSPRYVTSEWCLKEMNEFYQACQLKSSFYVNNKARIFKVVKTPVPLESHPAPVANLLGYEFYHTNTSTGRTYEYALAFNPELEQLFWEKLNDLVNDISVFLKELEHTPNVHTTAESAGLPLATNPGEENLKVFLAESSFDTQLFRENIKRELQDRGFTIYPDKPLPLHAPQLLELIDSYLDKVDLSIHLVGNNYGIVPEGNDKSLVELQSGYVSNHAVPQLIWVLEGYSPTDERQSRFVQHLFSAGRLSAETEIIQGALEEFKAVVVDKLSAIAETRKKEALAAQPLTLSDDVKTIYLMCDKMDLDEIRPLEDFLFEIGYEVVVPVFEGQETLIREDHLENLKTCTAAIIFFGFANELWLRSKMRDFFKIRGYGRMHPLEIKAVYLSGPLNSSKQRFRTLEADVINGMDGLAKDKLIHLLSK